MTSGTIRADMSSEQMGGQRLKSQLPFAMPISAKAQVHTGIESRQGEKMRFMHENNFFPFANIKKQKPVDSLFIPSECEGS